ncbi:MAG: ribose-5-phosphate isomerase RpiA [Armatimonadota bacterium]
MPDMNLARLKQQAAERAVQSVASGMVVGLGHGSTAAFALRRMAELLRSGELTDLHGVPCSLAVEHEARALGIPLTTLEDVLRIDLTIDGADEVTAERAIIKGGGGALLREKIVAQASRRVIIIVDSSKLSPRLGTRSAVPVEVLEFGWRSQAAYLEELGGLPVQRMAPDGTPFRTDQGNFILDCDFGIIRNPAALAERLQARAGILAHGLFLGLATEVIVAGEDGIRVITGNDDR